MKKNSLLYAIYYRFFLEKQLKIIITYLLLTLDEINIFCDTLKVFSVISLSKEGFYCGNDGLFYVHCDIGALKSEYNGLPLSKIKKEILVRFKKFYFEKKGIYIPADIQLLTEDHLVLFYPISDYGKKNFDKIQKMKNYSVRYMNDQKSIYQKKLNDAMKNRK